MTNKLSSGAQAVAELGEPVIHQVHRSSAGHQLTHGDDVYPALKWVQNKY